MEGFDVVARCRYPFAMSSHIDGVLFDLDGTLVRSPLDFEAMRREVRACAAAHGVEPSSLRAKDVLGMVDEASRAIDRPARFLAECEEAIVRCELAVLDRAGAFDGAVETLAWLIEHGVKVGIVTRNSRAAVSRLLDAIALPHQVLVTRNEAPRPKPDPSHLLHALALLEVAPERAIMVGDHPMDIAAGRAAGMRAIGIAHDGAVAPFEGTGAAEVFTSFAAFRAWLESALRKV